MSRLREALAAAEPRFPLKKAWQPLVAGLRADARATGERSPYASRRAIDQALDAPLRDGADVGALKAALHAVVRGEPGAPARAAELLASVVRPRATRARVSVTGWPAGFDTRARRRLLGGEPGEVAAEEASLWLRTLDGLWLGGRQLRIDVEVDDDAWLPPPGRGHRRRPQIREPWLPHLDDEGRFSLTPEAVADRQAAWLAHELVVDAFCGCGGNAIAFARAGARVVAIDRDRVRLALARRNARALGVDDRITFLCGDARELLAGQPTGAAVFLDPPWGGEHWDRERITWDELVGELELGGRTVMLKAPRSLELATLPGEWEVRWEVERGFVRLLTALRRH